MALDLNKLSLRNLRNFFDRNKEKEGIQLFASPKTASNRVNRASNQARYSRGKALEFGPARAVQGYANQLKGFADNASDSFRQSIDLGKQRQKLINERQAGRSFKDRLKPENFFGTARENRIGKDLLKTSGSGLWNTGKLAYGLQPKPTALLGGALSAGFAGFQGEDPYSAFGSGSAETAGLRVLTQFTDPQIEKIASKVAPEASKFLRQFSKRSFTGIANIVEDHMIAALDDVKPTFRDDLLSFGIGFVASSGDNAVEKFRKDMHKAGVPTQKAEGIIQSLSRIKDEASVREITWEENGKVNTVTVNKAEAAGYIARLEKAGIDWDMDVKLDQGGFIRLGGDAGKQKSFLDDFQDRIKPKTDAELKLEYQDKWNVWGKSEFGNKFDQKKWDDIFENAWSKSKTAEEFVKTFETNAKSIGGSDQSVKRLLREFFPKRAEQAPPPLSEADYGQLRDTSQVGIADSKPIAEPTKIQTKQVKQKAERVVNKQIKTQTIIEDDVFKSIADRKTQVKATSKIQHNLKNVVDYIDSKIEEAGVKSEDFFDDVDAGGTKYPELFDLHTKFVNRMAESIGLTDPNFRGLDNYIPRMRETNGPNPVKEVEGGLWISQQDLELGSFEHRTGNLKDWQKNYKNVMNSYIDQFVTKKYLENLKPENELQKATLEYTRAVSDKVKSGDVTTDIPRPDFVAEGNKIFKPTKTVDFKLGNIGEVGRTNNNIMKNVGGDINDSWVKFRDLKDTGNWRLNSFNQAKALQNLTETAGKYKFEDPRTQLAVNEVIADMVSIRQTERSVFKDIASGIEQTFAMAHLGGSFKTGGLQLLETTKMPAFATPKEIATGAPKAFGKANAKRLTEAYGLKEFDNPFDLDRMKADFDSQKPNLNKKVKLGFDRFKDILFTPIAKGERIKNLVFASVAEQNGKAKGLKGDELRTHVRDILFNYGNVASKSNRAQLFNKSGTRLLFQYSQYNMKNAQQIADAFNGGETGEVMKLATSQLVNIGIIMAVTGLPLKFAINQLAPAGLGPIVTFTKSVADNYLGNNSEDSKKKKLERLFVQNIVPAGTQAIRTKEGFEASKGFNRSSSGRVNFFGEPAGPVQTGRALLFGKNALPDVRKFYNEDQYPLGEKQSAAFLAKEGEDQTAFGSKIRTVSDTKKATRQKVEDALAGKDVSFDTDSADLDITKERIKIGDESLTGEELAQYYTRNVEEQDDGSRFSTITNEKEVLSQLGYVSGHDKLSDEQKASTEKILLNSIGMTREDYDYYKVAKISDVDTKMAYMLDVLDSGSITDRKGMLDFMADGRKKVSGRYLLSSGMIDQFEDMGLINSTEAKALKNLDYIKGKDGSYSPKVKTSGRGKSAKLKSIKLPQSAFGKRTNIKVPKIKSIDKLIGPSVSSKAVSRIRAQKPKLETASKISKIKSKVGKIQTNPKFNL